MIPRRGVGFVLIPKMTSPIFCEVGRLSRPPRKEPHETDRLDAHAQELNKFSIAPGDATAVKVVLAQQAKPTLEVVLTAAKAGEMAEFTQANLHNKVALDVAGETVSTPLVNAPISGGALTIELDDADVALRLAKKLMAD